MAADFSFTLPTFRNTGNDWSGATYKSADGEEYSVKLNSDRALVIEWKTVASKLIAFKLFYPGYNKISTLDTQPTRNHLVKSAPSFTIPLYNYSYTDGAIIKITISPHINFNTSAKESKVTKPAVKQAPVMEKKLDHLSTDMKKLLNLHHLSDIVLTDGKTEIHSHKVILSLRSEVFAKMLEHPFKEKLENRITIEDISMPVLNELLHFMYTGTILIKDANMARDLYIASDKYAVKELRNICSEILKKVNINSVLDTLLLSDLHDDKALKNSALNFVSQNYSEVKALKNWNDFIKAHQALAIEILSFVIDKKN